MLALVINDNNTRYLISCTLHTLITADDIVKTLNELVSRGHKPSKILADLGPQFRDIFEEGCKKLKIEVKNTLKH